MNRNELQEMKSKEYALLNSFTTNYRMPASSLPDYTECLDRIRAINTQIDKASE